MIVLDTHVLVWGRQEPHKLSRTAFETIETAGSRAVSAASLYEISLKGSRGKWPEVEDLLLLDMESALEDEGISVLPATGAIMEMAGGFGWTHRDPFDRIILATALIHSVPVISKDATLDTLGDARIRRVW